MSEIDVLVKRAEELIAAVTYDDSGTNGKGGNGGLLSRETIRKTDALRLALYDVKRATTPTPIQH